MGLRFITIVFSLLLFICVEEGLAIKCFECRSDMEPKCSDPFDNSTIAITDCKYRRPIHLENGKEVQATMCHKSRQKENGVWKYTRGCGYPVPLGDHVVQGEERLSLVRTGTDDIFMEYYTCDQIDACNGGSGLKLTMMTYYIWCIIASFLCSVSSVAIS